MTWIFYIKFVYDQLCGIDLPWNSYILQFGTDKASVFTIKLEGVSTESLLMMTWIFYIKFVYDQLCGVDLPWNSYILQFGTDKVSLFTIKLEGVYLYNSKCATSLNSSFGINRISVFIVYSEMIVVKHFIVSPIIKTDCK